MMKKTLIWVLFLAGTLFLPFERSDAANFVEVYRNDNNYHIYIDSASIEDKGDYFLVWEKYIPQSVEMDKRKKEYGHIYSHMLVQEAFKKKYREVQSLWIIDYATDGSVLNQTRRPYSVSGYKQVVPNSIGAVLWDAVMRLSGNS